MVSASRIQALDALLVIAPLQGAARLRSLPAAPAWLALHQSGEPHAGEVRSSAIGARSQCAAIIGYVAADASSFELLTLAGKMLAALGHRPVAKLGCVVLADAAEAGWDALLSAALARAFALPKLRSKPGTATRLTRIDLFAAPAIDLKRIVATAKATNLVRWLTALPPNLLDAAGYRRVIEQLARQYRLKLRWYSHAQLERMGAGAFAAVARANLNGDAGIAHLSYGDTRGGSDVALVGKGIVFDTGGINLKPHRSMFDMHTDMSGSAVALATLLALAEQRAPLSAEAWLAISENNIGPDAYRPQEVVRALNGTTIQVIHSDAEGRMALADTLTLAARARPRLIVDFATLTGACVMALGERYSGVFSRDAKLAAQAVASGVASGERVWSFPMDADYDEELESPVADVVQCTLDSKADHILAARFLARFVPAAIPWLHVDLSSATRKGGLGAVGTEVTGFGARFTLQLLSDRPVRRTRRRRA
ncbi:MAG: M17 family metallopeptidase [Steroidobacteraceae bacterium]